MHSEINERLARLEAQTEQKKLEEMLKDIEQKEKKNRLIFFFKEEDRGKKKASFDNLINYIDTTSQSMPSPFEVNLSNRIFNSARQN